MTTVDESASLDDQLGSLESLHHPVRRSLYRYVAGQPGEVSRDQAAAAVGVQRALAAFHLDKLVEGGLLEASYRRLNGRTGPGAGRPAKLYRRSERQYQVSLPPRQYEMAAALLAEALEAEGSAAADAVVAVARRFGRAIGEQVTAGLPSTASWQRRLAALADALERRGYEPVRQGQSLRLGNCPFHPLAQRHPGVVCRMNLALLEGVLEGLPATDLHARSDPAPGQCCVTVSTRRRT